MSEKSELVLNLLTVLIYLRLNYFCERRYCNHWLMF